MPWNCSVLALPLQLGLGCGVHRPRQIEHLAAYDGLRCAPVSLATDQLSEIVDNPESAAIAFNDDGNYWVIHAGNYTSFPLRLPPPAQAISCVDLVVERQ
jgi:hypothetical protein